MAKNSLLLVVSFLLSGFVLPLISMLIHYTSGLPADGLFLIELKLPAIKNILMIVLSRCLITARECSISKKDYTCMAG